MNLILETTDSVRIFTFPAPMLHALGVQATSYDWFVSDLETNRAVPRLSGNDEWLTGEALQAILDGPEVQFIWGVLSAVPKGMRPPVEVAPFADGNPTFWRAGELRPQLPSAVFEIVCWDSSATLLIGLSEEQATSFQLRYSDAKPLSEAMR